MILIKFLEMEREVYKIICDMSDNKNTRRENVRENATRD